MTHLVFALILRTLIWAAPAAAVPDGLKAYQAAGELHAKGKYKEAIASYEVAFKAGYLTGVTAYNIACAYAKMGDKDSAFKWLEKAQTFARALADQMKADTDLEPLHSDPRWPKALAAMDAASWPCKHDSKNRQFDFWIGDWNVADLKGNKLGESHVELMLGSCIIYENWTGGRGGNGKSFNLWDAGRKKWLQTWVDDSGSLHQYQGDFIDGAMRYAGETFGPDGTVTHLRMTFTPMPDGKVRQFMETSSDGTTWATAFDGYYAKKS